MLDENLETSGEEETPEEVVDTPEETKEEQSGIPVPFLPQRELGLTDY